MVTTLNKGVKMFIGILYNGLQMLGLGLPCSWDFLCNCLFLAIVRTSKVNSRSILLTPYDVKSLRSLEKTRGREQYSTCSIVYGRPKYSKRWYEVVREFEFVGEVY